MAKYLILHNPKCSKSRQALKLLEEEGLSYEVREYLVDELKQTEIKDILSKADFEIDEMIRKKEAKEFDVDLSASRTSLVKAIADYPKILQRPIVVKGKKATIARDPEWLERL